jgi:hypothetical protein
MATDEDWAGTCRLTRTLAPGILSLARLSMSFRISAEREGFSWPQIVESWSRVVEGSGKRHRIDADGTTLLEAGFA